jgi:tetratricopeptide (TPR) repeat protein
MTEADIQRWSREVAEDPGAPSFVRLARAYRKQGRRAVAREVIERGLGANPEDLGAHSLLALIHLEEGDRERARDEWETVLRLDADHFDGLRGLGFLALERNDLAAARRYLDHAARVRPGEPAVAEARQLLERRADAPAAAPAARAPTAAASTVSAGSPPRPDPSRLFESLQVEPTFMGGLVLDEEGRPLAGSVAPEDHGAGELVGALLNGVGEEAARTAELLGIGSWERLLIEGDGAILHATALADGAMLVVAARPGTPAGWVVRLSGRARTLAERFMEAAT